MVWSRKLEFGCAFFCSILMLFLILRVPVSFAGESEFRVESTTLQVYRDGVVRISQTLIVNETVPALNLPLLTSSVDNFIVLDENNTVLGYEVDGSNLAVFTLGTTSVSLQYDTAALTKKEFDIWSLILDTPFNLTALLPEESTVVYLSEIPNSIDTENNKIALFLLPGRWEISYIFPLEAPSKFEVRNLEVTPRDVEAGKEVSVSVEITNIGGQTGSHTIPLVINYITEETKTVSLAKGESTTTEFKVTKHTAGTYNVEIAGLFSDFIVRETTSNGEPSNQIPAEYFILVAVAIVAILSVVLILVRRQGHNIEKIFKAHPQLKQEDKDVIRFLAEKKGKAFEAEIRQQFPNLPRTSLWRLVRRLERMEIVKVKKIGLENQVELRK